MQDLNLSQLQPYILLLTGIAAIWLPWLKRNKTTTLKLTGEKVEGIIFELGYQPGKGNDEANVFNKVTVRFVIKAQEWITADIDQDSATFYTGQYKTGEAVEVYYDRENPRNFFVDTKQSEERSKFLFVAVGAIFVIIGFYQLFITPA